MSSGRSAQGLSSIYSRGIDVGVCNIRVKTITGNVIFENVVTFSSNVKVESNVHVAGAETVTSHFYVGGDASITGDLKIDGACTLTSVHGVTASFTGNMTVGGILSLTTNTPAAAGAGILTVTPSVLVRRINHEIITTIYVDIGAGDIKSKNDEGDVIGEDGEGNAYLTKLTTTVNGIVYKVEMACLETPTTGDDDIDLYFHTSALDYDGDASGGLKVINAAGAHVIGKAFYTGSGFGITAGGHNYYVYLVSGNGDTAGTYNAGKFLIKIYGVHMP
jgi:hypothetical protein